MLDDADLSLLLAALDAAPERVPTPQEIFEAAVYLGWLPQRPVLAAVVPARPSGGSIPKPTEAG